MKRLWSATSKKQLIFVFLLLVCVYYMWYQRTIVNKIAAARPAAYPSSIRVSDDIAVSDGKLPNNSISQVLLDDALKHASVNPINILVWSDLVAPYIQEIVEPSDCGLCHITHNKTQLNETTTKAVVFYFNDVKLESMPPERRPDQYYVWLAMESCKSICVYRTLALEEWDGVFNLTMTYRRDSDIYLPWGTLANVGKLNDVSPKQGNKVTTDQIVKRKKKLALWVVSNCRETAGAIYRMEYAMKLVEAGLDIDLGGKCFPNGIKKWNIEEYKFYLAFENTLNCKDYITEKFYNNSLRVGTVPVVLGAAKSDYVSVAPKHSFIYAHDFTIPELVQYLKYLDSNDEAYMEYLEWRDDPSSQIGNPNRKSSFCQLCRVLHGINVDNVYNSAYAERYADIPLIETSRALQTRAVKSLSAWFYSYENKRCRTVFQFSLSHIIAVAILCILVLVSVAEKYLINANTVG